jgi:hypothetical protein
MVDNSDVLLDTTINREREIYWIIEHDDLCWAPGEA